MNTASKLLDARKLLVDKFPWFAVPLQRMYTKISDKVPTAGVTVDKHYNVILIVNPTYAESLPLKHLAGVLAHEVLHVVLNHIIRGKKFENKGKFNAAADIALNQYIDRSCLPDNALYPEIFNLPLNLTADQYYDLLPNDVDYRQNEMDSHDWDEIEKLPKAAQQEIARRMRKAGVGSNELDNLLKELTEPKVDWRQVLANFVASSISRETEYTRTRANRRLGFFAEGEKKKYTPKILVAVDESGSVDDEMLTAFISEIKKIETLYQEEFTVVRFTDTISHVSKTVDNVRHSTGGTDFQAVIDYASENGCEALIIFTDGYASEPTKPRFPVLWAIPGSTSPVDSFFGIKIAIEVDEKVGNNHAN